MKTKCSCRFSFMVALSFVLMMGLFSAGEADNNRGPVSPANYHRDKPGNTTLYTVSGSTDVMTFDSFKDLKGYESCKNAINWYLSSGLTNGGQTWNTFEPASAVERWEVAHNLQRFYIVVCETGGTFDDVGMIFTADEDRFFGSVTPLYGAGIIDADDSCGTGKKCFRPHDTITLEEMLVWFYRAINSSYSATVPGTSVAAGSAADLKGYKDAGDISSSAVEAVAGMIKSGYYKPKGKTINPHGEVSRADMVNLYYNLRYTRGPNTMLDYAEARIKANPYYIDGGRKKITGKTLVGEEGVYNTSIVYAKNGAQVSVKNCDITSYSDMQYIYNGVVDNFAYRWGLNGTIAANGVGTRIEVVNTSVNTTSPNSSYPNCGYAFYPVCHGTIVVKDSDLYSTTPSFELCFQGKIIFDNVNISGTSRTYTSDHFGGVAIYNNVYSEKTKGGGFFLDESTTGEFYNSTLIGDDFLAIITGIGKCYMKNTTVEMGSGIQFTNNTSIPTDIATCTFEGGSFTITNGDLFAVKHGQNAIIKISGSEINLADGKNLLYVTGDSHGASKARLYLKDVDVIGNITVDEGCSAEIYLENSTITGDVTGDDVTITKVPSKPRPSIKTGSK